MLVLILLDAWFQYTVSLDAISDLCSTSISDIMYKTYCKVICPYVLIKLSTNNNKQ